MNRKRIIIIGSIALIALMVIGFTMLLINMNKKVPEQTNIIPSKGRSDELAVIQSSPSDKSTNVAVSEKIVITFNRALTDMEEQTVSVDSQPPTAGKVSWSPDKTSLTYDHDVPFDSKALYTFTITSSTIHYVFSFTTTSSENVTQTEAQSIQTAADKDFADTWNTIDTSYPWYRKLPLDDPADKYFVYFDIDKKIFIAKIYADPSEVNAIQTTIQNKLQELGVDLQRFKIQWLLQ